MGGFVEGVGGTEETTEGGTEEEEEGIDHPWGTTPLGTGASLGMGKL